MSDALHRTSEDQYVEILESFPALIWRSGTSGLCDYFNTMWLEFTGRTMGQEVGEGWAEGVHPEDLDRCLKTYLDAFALREPFLMDYRLRRHDGEWRWLADYGRPFHDLDGEFAGYIGSCYDITDRVAREADLEDLVRERTSKLEAAVSSIELASETKSRFLHAMSHELRTPLNSILGFSGVLLGGLAGPMSDEQRTQLQMIRESGLALLDLVSGMLTIAEHDRSDAPMTPEDVDVCAALTEAEGETAATAAFEIRLPDCEGAETLVRTDRACLRDALVFLFKAVAAASPAGVVGVSLERTDGAATVVLECPGAKIAEAFALSLDEDFGFLGAAEGAVKSRNALGFMVARSLLARLGGTVESAEVSGGSRLELVLPDR